MMTTSSSSLLKHRKNVRDAFAFVRRYARIDIAEDHGELTPAEADEARADAERDWHRQNRRIAGLYRN